jgi:hypothetical protein
MWWNFMALLEDVRAGEGRRLAFNRIQFNSIQFT